MRRLLPLPAILLVFVVVGTLYAVYTPDWEAPDEPAHYNYVRQIAGGHLPVIEPSDYDQETINEIVFELHFPRGMPLDSLSYEDWQPPLYYLLQVPIYLLSGGSLLALRLFSLLLGAGVIVLTYFVARRIFREQVWAAATAAVFVAFIPQHLAILASVNNDSLAELLIAATLFLLIGWLESDSGPESHSVDRRLLLIGTLLGLGLLTKGTVYPIVLVAVSAVIWRICGNWRLALRRNLELLIPATGLGSIWWVRNIVVYGGFDFLGRAAHDAVVTGQPLTSDLLSRQGLAGALLEFATTTFHSFWAQFGWMTVPLPGWAYRPLWAFAFLVLAGLAIWVAKRDNRQLNLSPDQAFVLALGFVLTVFVHVGYNFTFQQHQGRYLFPALIPIGVGTVVGFSGWMQLVGRRVEPLFPLVPVVLAALLIGLDIWALFGVLIPVLG